MEPLKFVYLANILMFVPIVIYTLFHLFPTDQGVFKESMGWRMLVGSIWLAILVLSILGFSQPLTYSPVLLLQLVYKVGWLGVYVTPRLLRGQLGEIPWAMTITFTAIVIAWALLIPWDHLIGFP